MNNEELKNKKLYQPIGTARLLDIEIYLDGECIYSGRVEDAKQEYKKLRYSEIELSNNKVKYYVYSELQ